VKILRQGNGDGHSSQICNRALGIRLDWFVAMSWAGLVTAIDGFTLSNVTVRLAVLMFSARSVAVGGVF
jgi:hypothetical protein